MLADNAIHDRLSGGGLVGLVMAETAIADQIDDHVLAEAHAVGQCQTRDLNDRLGVIAIHMKDGRLEHLGDVAAIHGRARIGGLAGGKAHLIVDDQMQRATGIKTAGLRQLHGLHDHALTGERRITVDEHRHDPSAFGIATTLLPGAYRTLDYRINDFQVGGIEGQRHVHVTGSRLDVRRVALVVFDVAGALQMGQVVLTFELGKQL